MAELNYSESTIAELEMIALVSQVQESDRCTVMKALITAAFLPVHGLNSHRMKVLAAFTAQLIRSQEAETAQA